MAHPPKYSRPPRPPWTFAGQDRRTCHRYPCAPDTAATVTPGGGPALRAQVLDLSTDGIGFLLPQPLGHRDLVILQMDSWTGPREIAVQVAQVAPQGGAWFHVGEFQAPLSIGVVAELLSGG